MQWFRGGLAVKAHRLVSMSVEPSRATGTATFATCPEQLLYRNVQNNCFTEMSEQLPYRNVQQLLYINVSEQLLYINVQWFRSGLVVEAHRLLCMTVEHVKATGTATFATCPFQNN